jgi:hypothetical protein
MKMSGDEVVNTALLQGFKETQAERPLVSGPLCAQKATFFPKPFGLEHEFINDAAGGSFHMDFKKSVQEETVNHITEAPTCASAFQVVSILQFLVGTLFCIIHSLVLCMQCSFKLLVHISEKSPY